MRRKDEEKQERIKQAVMRLSLREGFAGTSVSKIAREAGVSPATVYIYYENKEEMLKDIYLEYSQSAYQFLSDALEPEMSARRLIETTMEMYYQFIEENEEIFSFVEQFSRCPVLSCQCGRQAGSGVHSCGLFGEIDRRKAAGEIRGCDDRSIAAFLFAPVREIAGKTYVTEEERDELLQEIIQLAVQALLV